MTSVPRVGVSACVWREDKPGAILVGQRKGSHGAGKWATPGGHLEFGEELEQCAARELAEETGLSYLATPCVLGITNDVMAEEKKHYITVFVAGPVAAGAEAKVLEPEKCLGWEWVALDSLHSLPLFLPLINFLASPLVSKLRELASKAEPAGALVALPVGTAEKTS